MNSQPVLRSLGLLSATGAVALLSACGGGDAAPQAPAPTAEAVAAPAGPAPAPAAHPAAANTECGAVPAVGAARAVPTARANVVVRAGAVDCPQATDVFTQYFRKLTPADAARPDGAGPVVLGGWTCGSGSPTDPTTCSTEDGRQIDAVPAK
jgi:hypothetical protein